MRVRPLTGQVLIEILPEETQSYGGIFLPQDLSTPPEIVQESHRNPQKPSKNQVGIVREIGNWPKLANGMALMPEFGKGAKVVFNPWRGTTMQRGISERFKMVSQDDILAVLT